MASVNHFLKWAAVTALTLLAGLVMTLSAIYLYLNPQVPDAASYREIRLQTPLRIFAADGSFIAEFGERRRIPVAIDQVPMEFRHAILNTEDRRFYSHGGIDYLPLLKAAGRILLNPDEIPPGASTITMQLARNVSFTLEQTFLRKFKEILLAVKIERELEKDEILELYLNVIPFGQRAYGVEAAAQTYYGRSLHELTLAEMAMLAGIPQAPSIGNPVSGPERAMRRRNLVLRNMYEQGSIDAASYREALAAPNTARLHRRRTELSAPWVAEAARRYALERFGRAAYEEGFEVHTTIDPALQASATSALRSGLEAYDRRHGYRGPERTLTVPDELDETVLERWQRTLQQTPVLGGQLPALVLATEESHFVALLASGEQVDVPLAGMRWARPYLTVNSRGARPDRPDQVVAPGHLVRLQQDEDHDWRLGQIPDVQGALASLRPQDGAIRAMAGGYDFRLTQFNHATQGARQPGSAFKPFIYSAALEHGQTAASIFNDAPLVFEDANLEAVYRPRNDSGQFGGPTRIRTALYRSVNLVSMRVLMQVGAGNVIDHAARLGFDTSSFPRNLQLALGGGTMATTPMDMARAYAVYANGGYLVEPWLVSRIERGGEPVYLADPAIACEDTCELNGHYPAPDETFVRHAPRVLDERTAYIMHSMLGDVIRHGTGRRARALERDDLGGKTGTTNEADTWFAGYQRELASAVWVGFSDNRPLGSNVYGSNTALPIWIDFMRTALPQLPPHEPEQPPGIVRVRIDPSTGLIAPPGQQNAIFELFTEETAPQAESGQRSDPAARPESIF